MDGRRRALLSVPFGYASLHCEQGTPIPLANDLQLFNFRWQSLFKFGWQWTGLKVLNQNFEVIDNKVLGAFSEDFSHFQYIAGKTDWKTWRKDGKA